MMFWPPRGDPGQLHCPFDGLGPGVGEEEAVDWRWHDAAQLLDKLQHRLVDDDIGLGVQEKSCLLADRRDHLRMAVPGVGDADAAGEIQQAAAHPS